jgi:hypothetical protein
MNDKNVQSEVTKGEIFSQFKDSANHNWSEDRYVDIQLFSTNELRLRTIYNNTDFSKLNKKATPGTP